MEDTPESGFAVIYCRVSTNIQRDEGLSIEFQTKECQRWAQRNDLKVKGIYTDEAKTGTKTVDRAAKYTDPSQNPLNPENYPKGVDDYEYKDELKLSKIEGISHRMQFKTALKMCKEGDIFICYSLTRLARSLDVSLKVYSYLKEKNVFLYSVKDSLDSRNRASKLHFQMLSMFSELEADLIKDRVKSGMDLKRERGELVGQPPYGWMLSDGKQSDLIPNPKEQEVIKIMKHLRNQKDKTGQPISFCKIAKELNKREFKTKLGKAWTHVQVQRVLQGKCDPKVTKGCKKSSTPTVNNSTASQIVDDADTAIQNSVNEVIPTEQNEINVSDKTEIPDSDSISKQDEQLMKDYFEFMKFKKMKESFSLGV